jgi:hypothetical protein
LLFAGTTFFPYAVGFNYSILKDIVIKLKQWSISAGNYFYFFNVKINNGTSETLCSETVEKLENIKNISVHVPKHAKPISQDQFGYYLAGLIDGAGHFSNNQEFVIEFHPLDASLAYFLKKRIGYGRVKKVKTNNSIIFIIPNSNFEGLKKVLFLINGKFRSENIFNQITTNLLNNSKFSELQKINLKIDLNKEFKNHWLAGFSDATASFQINIYKDNNNKLEIHLNFKIVKQLALQTDNLLLLIKEFLGGNISYNKNNNNYYLDSTSFGSAKKVIDYFDHYHLLSTKQVNFLKWRKSYIIIQNKDYLNQIGIDKIIKYKNTMNR